MGGRVNVHPMTINFELFNIVEKNDFLNNIFKNILVSLSYFSLLSQFHYPSLLNDVEV